MRIEPVPHGADGDMGRLVFREAEDARRDAAEGDAFETMLCCKRETGLVARGQKPAVLIGQAALHDGTYRVQDEARGKMVARCDLGLACRLIVALCLHEFVAVVAHLDACHRLLDVVDAVMVRQEAAEHLAVGRIDDGIDAQPRDVALPKRKAGV